MFKCLNGECPKYLHDIFQLKSDKYNLRGTHNGQRIVQPKVNSTRFGLNSLRYNGALIWNRLPDEFKDCLDENTFKNIN